MALRDWIGDRLHEDEYGNPTGVIDVFPEGTHSLRVTREHLPAAYIYCAEVLDEPFTPDDLEDALGELPGAQFIAVTKARPVAGPTYGCADELGIAVGGVTTLQVALRSFRDIGSYRSKNHEYVQRRLNTHAVIRSWRRVGYDAYQIKRSGRLRDLVIITLNPYEITQEEAFRLLDQHSDVNVDALVNTNPNCRGFSRATLRAVSHAGVQILTLEDFMSSLRKTWE